MNPDESLISPKSTHIESVASLFVSSSFKATHFKQEFNKSMFFNEESPRVYARSQNRFFKLEGFSLCEFAGDVPHNADRPCANHLWFFPGQLRFPWQ
jgi:hypothetical protein